MAKKKNIQPEDLFDPITGEILVHETPDGDLIELTTPKIKTQWNRPRGSKDYEDQQNKISQTIPDQSMSVVEILDRYKRGLPISGERVPIYHGEEFDMPDLKKLDLSEIEDLKEKNADYILGLRQELQKREKANEQLRKEKEFQEWKKLQEEKEKADQPKTDNPQK